jgi:hypothetical protein
VLNSLQQILQQVQQAGEAKDLEAENFDARGHVQKSLSCQGERERDGWEEKLYKFLLYHSLSLK